MNQNNYKTLILSKRWFQQELFLLPRSPVQSKWEKLSASQFRVRRMLRIIYGSSSFVFDFESIFRFRVGKRCHRDMKDKYFHDKPDKPVRIKVSCKKDFFTVRLNSLYQSRRVSLNCLITTERTWNCSTISGRSLCVKYSSIKWAQEGILTKHLCVLYANKWGKKSFCKTYILHLPQEESDNHSVKYSLQHSHCQSACFLDEGGRIKGEEVACKKQTKKPLSIGFISYLWYIFEARKFIKNYSWK